MRNEASFGLLLVIALGAFAPGQASSSGPSRPPIATKATFPPIFDKGNACAGGPCGVPTTGQTDCWDETGNPINCAGTGQDGEYQPLPAPAGDTRSAGAMSISWLLVNSEAAW